jgi:hypothetical protein
LSDCSGDDLDELEQQKNGGNCASVLQYPNGCCEQNCQKACKQSLEVRDRQAGFGFLTFVLGLIFALSFCCGICPLCCYAKDKAGNRALSMPVPIQAHASGVVQPMPVVMGTPVNMQPMVQVQGTLVSQQGMVVGQQQGMQGQVQYAQPSQLAGGQHMQYAQSYAAQPNQPGMYAQQGALPEAKLVGADGDVAPIPANALEGSLGGSSSGPPQ